jgi:hypothetical protein
MNRTNLGFVCAIALLGVASSTAASAQVQIGNGATLSIGTLNTNRNWINLGTTPSTSFVSNMPMSLSYGTTNLNVTFNGFSEIAGSSQPWNPSGSDFFRVTSSANPSLTGNINFAFSQTQKYFGAQWGSPDGGNIFDFYNGSQLIASANSANFAAVGGTWAGAYAEFSFGEVGFDRVVARATGNRLEFDDVSFGETVGVAPIPIGGIGGIVAFLGMFGARRGGAPFRFALRNAKAFCNVRRASIA